MLAALLRASAMSLAEAICWTRVSTHSSGDLAFATGGAACALLVTEGPAEDGNTSDRGNGGLHCHDLWLAVNQRWQQGLHSS